MKKNPSVLYLLLTVGLYAAVCGLHPLLLTAYEDGTVWMFPLLALQQFLSALPPLLTFGTVFAVWKTHTFGTGMFFFGFFALTDLCARLILNLTDTAPAAFEGFGIAALSSLLSALLTAVLCFLILLAGKLLFLRQSAVPPFRFFDRRDSAFRALLFAAILSLLYKWVRVGIDFLSYAKDHAWILTGADAGDVIFQVFTEALFVGAAFCAGRWMQKRFDE